MEHRYSIRKALVLDIELNHLRLGSIQCKTRDVGMGGMFVEMGSSWLPANAIVKVALKLLDANNVMRRFLIEALVVHNQNGGVGLMFNDVDAAFHQTLHDLLFGKFRQLVDRQAVSGL